MSILVYLNGVGTFLHCVTKHTNVAAITNYGHCCILTGHTEIEINKWIIYSYCVPERTVNSI